MKVTATSSNVALLSKQATVASVAPEPPHQPRLDAMTHNHRPASPVRLTRRQLEVLSLLCEGLPNKVICRQLNISTGTVKVHIGFILRELGVSSRLQAVVAALRCGLRGGVGVGTSGQAW